MSASYLTGRARLLLLVVPFVLLRGLWRAGGGAFAGFLVGLLAVGLWHLLAMNSLDHTAFRWGAGLGTAAGATLGFGSSIMEALSEGRARDVMGSAAWATPRRVMADLAAPALATDPASLLVGRGVGRRGRLLRYAGPAHLLTVAPTRSGKGVGTVLPNLLTAARSIVCIDPKGENARIAARARRRFGPVFVLDPFGVSDQPAAAYDPTAVLDLLSPDLADDAATLADALVFDPPGQVSEAHWNEEAKALVAGLLMHLACTGATGSPRPADGRWTIQSASPSLPASTPPLEGHRGLPGLRRLLTLPPHDWDALLRAMMANTDTAGGLVSRAAARQLGKADREAAGVLSSAQRHTHFLDSPRMATGMSRTDFRWADLRGSTATVFLVLPPDRIAAYSRWLRLLVAQAIQELARTPQRPDTPPVLMLLDEFAALGRLEPVLSAAGLMAGLGLQLWPILQDLAQLRAAYGESAGTFLANSGLVQVSAPADLDTATWLSRTLGNATVEYVTASSGSSTPSGFGGGSGSVSEGTSTHLAGRPLLTPDEAMRLSPDRQVLFRPGKPPALTTKLRHYADPEFAGLADG